MTTLYKTDSKNKIRYLTVYTEDADLIQKSGLLDTESPITHRKTCKGKNIGRSNETRPEDQAEKEMESLIAEKLKEGYFYTIEEAKTIETLFPMLAKDYGKEKKKIDWNYWVWAQPKLDGMRCLITVNSGKVTLKSRDGRDITTMKHIAEAFSYAVDGTYDGELYAHGYTFQQNMEFIKKWREGESGSIQVKFHCYDVVEDNPYKDRSFTRYSLEGINHITIVKTTKIKSEDELKQEHQLNLADGYEGTIVRHGDDPYKINGRSSSLLKYKDFQDIAVSIIDIEPAEQRPIWGVPVLQLPDGKTFRAGLKYSHEAREEFLKNKESYIGKTAEVRFFEYTDEGIPRFPVMVGVREDK